MFLKALGTREILVTTLATGEERGGCFFAQAPGREIEGVDVHRHTRFR